MESTTNKRIEEAKRQDVIRRQIAALQEQLRESGGTPEQLIMRPPATPPSKRKAETSSVLAPSTPSPKKRKLDRHPTKASSSSANLKPPSGQKSDSGIVPRSVFASTSKPDTRTELQPALKPSNFVSKLASLASHRSRPLEETITRSSGFNEKPALAQFRAAEDTGAPVNPVQERDDRLALVESLELGPMDHKAPFDDPHFQKLEPNSGIHLSSRKLLHDDFQDYLRGRYYLSPSLLYSVIRLLPNKLGYDVPVCGDWVTIAVIAERGPIKFTAAPTTVTRDEDEPKGNKKVKDDKADDEEWQKRRTGKKYVNIKLVDFGNRSRESSNAKATIKGDAFLTLLLFESDSYDKVTDEDGHVTKAYKGGSRGAFEAMSKLKEGSVIALLNPKILKPFQRSGDSPHPTSNILALTPESAEAIAIIGHARDLGMCTVTKRDGKVCGSWCDKRISENVCDYHVQTAVQSRRASRPEFSLGTSGMHSTSGPRKKPSYDPARQWGLKPATDVVEGTSTYVMSGHVVSDRKPGWFVHEDLGREAQTRAKRKMEEREGDKALQKLLKGDREGARAIEKAKEVMGVLRDKARGDNKKNSETQRGKGKGEEKSEEGGGSNLPETEKTGGAQKNAYSAKIIQRLGFDPTVKAGTRRRAGDSDTQKTLDALTALQSSRGDIQLGPRPGKRIRSGIIAPNIEAVSGKSTSSGTAATADPGSDEELETEMTIFRKELHADTSQSECMDESSDLEIEAPP